MFENLQNTINFIFNLYFKVKKCLVLWITARHIMILVCKKKYLH